MGEGEGGLSGMSGEGRGSSTGAAGLHSAGSSSIICILWIQFLLSCIHPAGPDLSVLSKQSKISARTEKLPKHKSSPSIDNVI